MTGEVAYISVRAHGNVPVTFHQASGWPAWPQEIAPAIAVPASPAGTLIAAQWLFAHGGKPLGAPAGEP